MNSAKVELRNWVDHGGPKRWIARLTVMGAQGYGPDTVKSMELLSGHCTCLFTVLAGYAKFSFVRHPDCPASMGRRLAVGSVEVGKLADFVDHFVKKTDAGLSARVAGIEIRRAKEESGRTTNKPDDVPD